jgi:anti-anti-sigma factor
MTQVWHGSAFAIEREMGEVPGTVIFRLSGPFTARTMYATLTPEELRDQLTSEPPGLSIVDLTEVPYIDSTALGMMVKHYVGCHKKGIRWIAAGANARILELLKLTKMDSVLPTCATVEDALM